MINFSLKNRFTMVLWGLLFVGLTSVYLLRISFYNQSAKNASAQQVTFENQIAISALTDQLYQVGKFAQTLSHSLALHIKVIERNQMILEQKPGSPRDLIESRMEKLVDKDLFTPEYYAISTTQEADYLRKLIAAYDNLFDRILVTDAFGFVCIASFNSDQLYFFQQDWWQRTLMLEPGYIYQFSDPAPEHAGYWFLSFPLHNYEDDDPVGVITVRVNFRHMLGIIADSWGNTLSNTYLVSDENYTWGPIRHSIYPSISELRRMTDNQTDPLVSKKPPFVASASSLANHNLPFLPTLNMYVINFIPIPEFFSVTNPVFQRFFAEWLLLLAVLTIFSWVFGYYYSKPVVRFVTQICNLTNPQKQKSVTCDDLSLLFQTLHNKFRESELQYSKQLQNTIASQKAFTDYAREGALESDRKKIAEAFLHISLETMSADAGILFIHNPDYPTPMRLQSGVSEATAKTYSSLRVFDASAKTIYFSWNHPDHQDVWNDDYQMILSVPIQTLDLRFGTLYLLFKQATDMDLQSDKTLDFLAQQCAIYSSRTSLYHSLERQINFTEGILSGVPWFICTINHDMCITWHNNSPILPGETIDIKLIGAKYHLLLPGIFQNMPECPVRKTLRDGQSCELVVDVENRKSQTHSIKINTYPCKDETGRFRSVILFLKDITKEKSIERETRNYMMAIDSIGDAVVITDMERRITFTNKAFTRILDYQKVDVLGHKFEFLISDREFESFKKILASASHKDTTTDEVELIDRHESIVPVSLTASIVKDAKGIPTGFVITCFDLTSRLVREHNTLKKLRELETIHALTEILNRYSASSIAFKNILEHVVSFSKCKSGVFVLFDTIDSDSKQSGSIQIDTGKPAIVCSMQIPEFFVKLIDEYRQGRSSEMMDMICNASNPLVMNNLDTQTYFESKLIMRMGFASMLVIPLTNQSFCFGYIMVFSSYKNHFKSSDTETFGVMASQIAFSLYGKYLQRQLEQEARYVLTGEIVADIGGDVNQVLQSLESSRHVLDAAIKSNNWQLTQTGWTGMSWHIWKLYQISSNIMVYDSDSEKIFFPENINALVRHWVNQMNLYSFSKTLHLTLELQEDFGDVYIYKPEVKRAFLNILTLAIDACWFEDAPAIIVRVFDTGQATDNYAIDVCHNGTFSSETPLLLTVATRCVKNHNGSVSSIKSDIGYYFRIVLPRYPIKK